MFTYPEPRKCDVLILTALRVEYQAVISYLSITQEIIHPQGTIYQLGDFSDQKTTWNVAVAEIGMGGPGAALETERAITFFSPEILFFVGIAGGIKDVQIGDVVAATKVYNYEAGKVTIDFQARPEVWRSSYALEQRARVEGRGTNWLARLNGSYSGPTPHVFIGAIAAGEKVIASKQASTYQLLRRNYEDALAVEMEGHGFLQAVRSNHTAQALVIRGISDLIDNKASAEQELLQKRASLHAAAFAFEIIARFNVPSPAQTKGKQASFSSQEKPFAQTSEETIKTKGVQGVRRKVFVSYNHNDAKWLERLRVHLAPIEREGMIELWDDTRIAIGQSWQTSIQDALETAKVAITLVSADFLASDFIAQQELPKLLTRAASEGLIVMPVIVSPCLFTSSSLGSFQAANDPNKPLSGMTKVDREKILVNLAKAIRKYLMEIEH